jgi:hypothetical protein
LEFWQEPVGKSQNVSLPQSDVWLQEQAVADATAVPASAASHVFAYVLPSQPQTGFDTLLQLFGTGVQVPTAFAARQPVVALTG